MEEIHNTRLHEHWRKHTEHAIHSWVNLSSPSCSYWCTFTRSSFCLSLKRQGTDLLAVQPMFTLFVHDDLSLVSGSISSPSCSSWHLFTWSSVCLSLKRQGINLLAVQPMFTLFYIMFFTIQNEISNMLAALQWFFHFFKDKFLQSIHIFHKPCTKIYVPTLPGDRGSTVVKVLCCKSEGCWFDPGWCQWIFHWRKILPITL